MTYHTGTIDIPVMNDIAIPDIEYQCDVTIKNDGLVIEDVTVSLWRRSLNSFDWVKPTLSILELITENVEQDHYAGRLDIDEHESNPAKLYKEDLL